MAGPERKIEDAFVKWCKETLGLKARKMKVQAERGWPDRTIVMPNGRIVCIEFKAPRGEPSPLQIDRADELRQSNVPVLMTSSLEEAKAWTTQHLRKFST